MFDHLDKATSPAETELQKQRRQQAELRANEDSQRALALQGWRGMNTTKEFLSKLQQEYHKLDIDTERLAFDANTDEILRAKTIEKATLRKVLNLALNDKYEQPT